MSPSNQPYPTTAPADGVEWRLPRHPRTVGRTRTLFIEQAKAWQLPRDTAETATLLLSELVTNAVRHSRVPGRQIGARFQLLSATVLRVEVSDAGNGLPVLRRSAPDDESGRGLALVEALSRAWGSYRRPYSIGKTVWFELDVVGPKTE
ncbi:ATP-binding protein [Streptomyces polygonati]|uniref:ATP-binding protein n=1 Tax=Streptomyces polygonati TaxID=1617087 RepID=A0ABV8HPE3_9ACTN